MTVMYGLSQLSFAQNTNGSFEARDGEAECASLFLFFLQMHGNRDAACSLGSGGFA